MSGDTLGAEHPDTLAGLLNLDVIVSEPSQHGTTEYAVKTRAHLEQLLGEGHPTVTELRAGCLNYRLIDPSEPF